MVSVRNKEARSIANQLEHANKNVKLIAGGISGGIYNINGTGTVLKVMLAPKTQKVLNNSNTQKVLNNSNTKRRNTEMNLQRRMARVWLAPPVMSKYILGSTKTYGGFLMKKLPPHTKTLEEYSKTIWRSSHPIKLDEKLKKMVKSAAKKMFRIGIHHGDLHDSNIMITYDPDTLKIKNVWIIDYGTATYIPIGYEFTKLAQPSYIYENNIWYRIPNPNGLNTMSNHNRQILAGLSKEPRNPFYKT